MGRTGHRSEMGVRAYKCGNADITCTVSKALDPPEPKFPKKELEDACGHLVDISNKLNVPEKLEVLGQTVVAVLAYLTTALSFHTKHAKSS